MATAAMKEGVEALFVLRHAPFPQQCYEPLTFSPFFMRTMIGGLAPGELYMVHQCVITISYDCKSLLATYTVVLPVGVSQKSV